MPASPKPKIAILGGGITGLAAAWHLTHKHPHLDWHLFEAAPRIGGVLETVNQDGWLIEQSADNFLTKDPAVVDLCRELGIADSLLPTLEDRRRAMVVRDGQVMPVPEGFVLMAPKKLRSILASPALSFQAKLRLACEPFIRKKKEPSDESVASFARRRLGQEVLDRLVQPLVAGIYTADPEKLSLAATLPQFIRQEAEYGSLWRANRNTTESSESLESGARYGLFMAPRNGMQQMVDALKEALPEGNISLSNAIESSVLTEKGTWQLTDKHQESQGEFAGVICTLPAYHAASVIEDTDSELSSLLKQIPYASASVVCLGVKDEQIKRPVDGFGFVVPSIEGRSTIATSFTSYKFPGRSPEGRTLIRTFVGGALRPDLAVLSDEDLLTVVQQDLSELIGLEGDPELVKVARWPQRMPQYQVGHLDLVSQIVDRQNSWQTLQLAGAAYRGVGIPQCVVDGRNAADKISEALK